MALASILQQVHPTLPSKQMHQDLGDALASSAVNGSNCNGPQNAIMVKELVPILISCAVWGPLLSHRLVLFKCDNAGVVAAVKKGSAREPLVMHLLHTLWFFVAHFDISINIAGVHNGVADTLSRDNIQQFFLLHPQVDLLPTPIPEELIVIISVSTPDWTSATFSKLFSTTISKV